MQKRLKTDPSDVAVVKGDPGTGKTTLVQKLCYDWAFQRVKTKKEMGTEGKDAKRSPFRLVLAIPLRSTEKLMFGDYVQLAIDFFTDVLLTRFQPNKAALNHAINELGTNLLVILDGLDEYASGKFADSPIAKLFAPPLDNEHSPCKIPPQQLSCKVIITSRPYALIKINPHFYPLRFQLCPLDGKNLKRFVTNYCKTHIGRAKVFEFLDKLMPHWFLTGTKHLPDFFRKRFDIRIPLILTFICYLAESDKATIPSTFTLIYDRLIGHMITREKKGGERLSKQIKLKSWKKSELARISGKLAFLGCSHVDKDGKSSPLYEFDEETMKKCGVTEENRTDCFSCGFLLDKYFAVEDSRITDFPHRSIQEFFAAVYCYQLMIAESKGERNSVVKTILNRPDSQFGQFLFGMCSNGQKFDQMSDWLQISFADIQLCDEKGIANLINPVNKSLTDCSKAEQRAMGRALFNSFGQIEAQLISGWNQMWSNDLLRYLNPEFLAALNVRSREKDSGEAIFGWYMVEQSSSDSARMVVLSDVHWSIYTPAMKFEKVEVFMWENSSYSIEFLSEIQLLPPIKVFNLHRVHNLQHPNFSVTILLERGKSDQSELRTFRLLYNTDDRHCATLTRNDKLRCLTKLDQFKTTILSVKKLELDKRLIEGWHNSDVDAVHFFKLTVSVRRSVSQSTLIFHLIKLALEVDYTDDNVASVASAIRIVCDAVGKLKDYLSDDKGYAISRVQECVYQISPTLPQLRSSRISIELKKDMISTLLSCIEHLERRIHSLDASNSKVNKIVQTASKRAKRRAFRKAKSVPSEIECDVDLVKLNELNGQIVQIAQLLAEIQINVYPGSPYRQAVEQILKYLSRSMRYKRHVFGGTVDDSVLMMLNQIVIQSDKLLIGEMGAVKIFCCLIKQSLDESEYISEWLKNYWTCLNNICHDCVPNQEKFLLAGGMELFQQTYERVLKARVIELFEITMRLMLSLSGNPLLRQKLENYCEIFWHIWCCILWRTEVISSRFESFLIGFRCAKVLDNLGKSSCFDQAKLPWDSRTTYGDGVKICPFESITAWRLDSETFLTYSSFKSELENLIAQSPEHQLLTVWTFANCTVTNAETYCPLLNAEGAVPILRIIIETHKLDGTKILGEVSRLAQFTIDMIEKFDVDNSINTKTTIVSTYLKQITKLNVKPFRNRRVWIVLSILPIVTVVVWALWIFFKG